VAERRTKEGNTEGNTYTVASSEPFPYLFSLLEAPPSEVRVFCIEVVLFDDVNELNHATETDVSPPIDCGVACNNNSEIDGCQNILCFDIQVSIRQVGVDQQG
jgi:hypothetical protein